MSKRIPSLILAFLMVFSTCAAFAVQVDWTDDERIAMLLGETLKEEAVEQIDIVQDLLYQLGIISDPSTLNKDAKLNTGDFLKAIAEISGAALTDDTELMYRQLKQGGYVNLSSSKSNVTMDNALFSAVALTESTHKAEAHGGYPHGYYLVAIQSGLLTNLKYSAKGKITVAEALQLYYNILSVDKPSLDRVKDNDVYYSYENSTNILEEKYNVTLKKGVITAAYLTGMYGPGSIGEDQIEIDRVVYDYAGDMAVLTFKDVRTDSQSIRLKE